VPERLLITQEMARLLGALAHPDRIRIIEELRNQEMCVNQRQDILGTSHSRVSQHLQVLRGPHLVEVRREGRRSFYSLAVPGLAPWLVEGMQFLAAEYARGDEVKEAVEKVADLWG